MSTASMIFSIILEGSIKLKRVGSEAMLPKIHIALSIRVRLLKLKKLEISFNIPFSIRNLICSGVPLHKLSRIQADSTLKGSLSWLASCIKKGTNPKSITSWIGVYSFKHRTFLTSLTPFSWSCSCPLLIIIMASSNLFSIFSFSLLLFLDDFFYLLDVFDTFYSTTSS